ncbi:MAG: hypothetical protein ACKOE2_00695 [Actinomycetales bacterium]
MRLVGTFTMTVAVTFTGMFIAMLTPAGPVASAAPAAPRAISDSEPVLAIGDSVMLGAKRCLTDLGIEVDAKGNRRISAGIDTLRTKAARIPRRVVVHLGANGGALPRELDRLMEVLGPDRRVYLLTIQLPDDRSRYSFEERTNAAIARLPHRYRNAYVLDWNRLSDSVDGLLGGDHRHLTNAGCAAYAAMVDEHVRSPLG